MCTRSGRARPYPRSSRPRPCLPSTGDGRGWGAHPREPALRREHDLLGERLALEEPVVAVAVRRRAPLLVVEQRADRRFFFGHHRHDPRARGKRFVRIRPAEKFGDSRHLASDGASRGAPLADSLRRGGRGQLGAAGGGRGGSRHGVPGRLPQSLRRRRREGREEAAEDAEGFDRPRGRARQVRAVRPHARARRASHGRRADRPRRAAPAAVVAPGALARPDGRMDRAAHRRVARARAASAARSSRARARARRPEQATWSGS